MATMIVGVGMTALMLSLGASTRTNDSGQKLATANLLAGELREWTLQLPWVDPDGDEGTPPGPGGDPLVIMIDDVNDMKNVTFPLPRNSRGQAMPEMTGWTEQVKMKWVDPADLTSQVGDGESNILVVELTLNYMSEPVLHTSWLCTKKVSE